MACEHKFMIKSYIAPMILVVSAATLTACDRSGMYKEPAGITSMTGGTFLPSVFPYEPAPGGEVSLVVNRIDGKYNESDHLGINSGTVVISPGQHLISIAAWAHSFIVSNVYSGIAVTPVKVTAGRSYRMQVERAANLKPRGFLIYGRIVDENGVPASEPFELDVVPATRGSAEVPIILPGKVK